MNIFRKMMVSMLRKAAGIDGQVFNLQSSAFGRLWGQATASGKSIDSTTAMQVSTAWACVRVLAETIGSLPWAIYEREAKTGNMTRVDHDLGAVLCESPNVDMTDVEFKEAKTTNLALQGNTYSLTDKRNDGSLISAYPIASQLVTVQRNKDSGEIEFKIMDRGKPVVYPRDKIWHVKGFGPTGTVGLSPIDYHKQSLGMALATEEFQARFFASGANPSWIVSIPNWLDKDKREIARDNLNRLWGGLGNAHSVQMLEGGMTAEAATMPLKDAQFLELRGYTVAEICRIYRMPPHLVADLSRSTNNNIEQQSLEFVMYTLAPYLTRIEASATRWLFKPADRRRFYLRFNVEGLLRADAAARAELHSKYVQNGIMNRNEVRRIEKMSSVDDPAMNSYTVQTNMSPIDQLAQLIAAQMAKPAAPALPPPQKESLTLNLNSYAAFPERQHKTHITNLLHHHDGNTTVMPATTKVDVHPPEINIAAPEINVKSGDVNLEGIADALQKLGALVASVQKEQAKPTRLIKDKAGNAIGTVKVDQIGEDA